MLTRIPLLPFDKFPNYKNIRHVHSPVLIMHSHADSVIAFWHGQKMFDLANQPKQAFWVRTPDHNEMDLVKGYDEAISHSRRLWESRNSNLCRRCRHPRFPDTCGFVRRSTNFALLHSRGMAG